MIEKYTPVTRDRNANQPNTSARRGVAEPSEDKPCHEARVAAVAERLEHAIEQRSTLEGFDFPSLMKRVLAEEQTSRDKSQIIALLREDGERWAKWLESQSDDFLAERVEFPAGMTPPTKTRFEMLLGAKEHEMHHRGQLMLIERMLGVVPHLTRHMQERMAAVSSGPVR
jgi:uncharacterized damage-inducible protein DinB